MTGRAVVILTEPARCELADADVLVQAVLQVQQLNKAGLGASQAFCDHPAAAMKFIEAYTKAYPELQQRSSDLPPPEALQSIVADGRVMPLQAPAPADVAKLGEATQLYPLYVLSLGAPDALMRALQHNRFAASDIQVVEIAPAEDERTESVSVAEAVAHEPLTRPSWRGETLAEPGRDGDVSFSSGELGASDPFKLASVEVDLDHIQVDRKNDLNDHEPDHGLDEPAIVVLPPAGGAAVDSGAGRPTASNGATVGVVPAVDSAIPTAHLGAAAPEPGAPSPSVPAGVTGPSAGPAGVPTDTTGAAPTAGGEGAPEPATGGDADSAEEASGGVDAPDDSAEAADDEPSAHDDDDDERPPAADGERASSSELDQAASAGEPAATDGRSFNDPGEDVLYPANASFAVDDDLAYPLPPGLVPDGDLLEALFGGTGESEVVDLEALFGGLSDSMVAIAPADFDLELMRARGAGRLGSDEATDSGMEPAVPEPQSSDGPEAEEESAQHERVPTVHDLDI